MCGNLLFSHLIGLNLLKSNMLYPKKPIFDRKVNMSILRSSADNDTSMRTGYDIGIILGDDISAFYNFINYGITPICLI